MSDHLQGMFFAGFDDKPAIDAHVADTELRLCTLNINSPSPARAQRLADWLSATGSNVLVLTEVQAGTACDRIRTTLDAHGYLLTATPGWRDQRFHTLVAATLTACSRGFHVPGYWQSELRQLV